MNINVLVFSNGYIFISGDIIVMAAKSASVAKREVTWSQKLTDFTIILEEGGRIRVHKHVLAENSEAFEAMLTQEYEETKNNEMVLEHFDRDTFFSFVDYLYADSATPKQ